jgi:DNA-directed RNA polymerase specialized sigma24 family protein
MMTTQYQFFEVQQEISMDDDLDLQLRQLVCEAQGYPAKSVERRKALNRLITKIQQSKKLKRFTQWQNLRDFEDIYHEAEAKTYLDICNNIDNYHPEHKVMAWVNQIFKWRFQDILRIYRNQPRILSLDELDSCNSDLDKSTSKELSRVEKELKDKLVSESENELELSATRVFVKNDPEGILQNTYIGEDTNANLQKIILMRLDNDKWEDISQKLGHPIPRLSELYQRNIKKRKIIGYFRKYLQ